MISYDCEKLCLFACKCDASAGVAVINVLRDVELPAAEAHVDMCKGELGSCNVSAYVALATVAAEIAGKSDRTEAEQELLQEMSCCYATLIGRFPFALVEDEPEDLAIVEVEPEGEQEQADEQPAVEIVEPEPTAQEVQAEPEAAQEPAQEVQAEAEAEVAAEAEAPEVPAVDPPEAPEVNPFQ